MRTRVLLGEAKDHGVDIVLHALVLQGEAQFRHEHVELDWLVRLGVLERGVVEAFLDPELLFVEEIAEHNVEPALR